MKTRTSLIAATLATLFAGHAFANTHGEDAVSTMTIDSAAPIRATLLPTVSIDATSARMRVADTAPIEVTLLPTVHVSARAEHDLAMTLLPTVRVTPDSAATIVDDGIAEADDVTSLPMIDDASPKTMIEPFGLRARAMPR
jgi:hypothetical protein